MSTVDRRRAAWGSPEKCSGRMGRGNAEAMQRQCRGNTGDRARVAARHVAPSKEGVRSNRALSRVQANPSHYPTTSPTVPPHPSDLRHRAGRARIRPPRQSLDDDQLLHALLPARSPQPARYRDAIVPAAAAIGSALLISNHVHYGIHSRIHSSRPQPILRH
jgi:hypothetical protein